MAYLVDTNIIVRGSDPGDPNYHLAKYAVEMLRLAGQSLCLSRQNLIEYRNVATRPIDKNGLGMSVTEADKELTRLESVFITLPDNDFIYAKWRTLVTAKAVSGRQVHDARLVAVMLTYGITHILTFNDLDFVRFVSLPHELGEGVIAVHPLRA